MINMTTTHVEMLLGFMPVGLGLWKTSNQTRGEAVIA
jgi:hypothetical protein